jgi:hypothetical protein
VDTLPKQTWITCGGTQHKNIDETKRQVLIT